MAHDVGQDIPEIEIGHIGSPTVIELSREQFRQRMAMPLTIAMIGLWYLPILSTIAFPDRAEQIRAIAVVVLPVASTAYAAVMGFYFWRGK